ncbi:signal peptide peptidase family protein [Cryptosporidium serpentis]
MSLKLRSDYIYIGGYLNLFLVIFLTWLKPLPVIVQMVMYTFPTIYIGSYLSLNQSLVNPITGEKEQKTESLTRKDAILFPLIGSVALLSLYLAYKFLPAYWVNLLLTLYLAIIGIFTLSETILQFSSLIINTKSGVIIEKYCNFFGLYKNSQDKRGYQIKITIHELWSFTVSFILGITWLLTDSWIIHNILAISFCIQAISLISLGSFKIGAILLSGLFVYDIFWVFGTNVMVTVAKSFQGPAKIIFPISYDPWKQSILGLGDIVIPGLFIALCLRFDLKDIINKHVQIKEIILSNYPVETFISVLIAYQLGLLITACVMFYFKAAQPALLYLVPFCILSLLASLYHRNQFIDAWNYSEETEDLNKQNKGFEVNFQEKKEN